VLQKADGGGEFPSRSAWTNAFAGLSLDGCQLQFCCSQPDTYALHPGTPKVAKAGFSRATKDKNKERMKYILKMIERTAERDDERTSGPGNKRMLVRHLRTWRSIRFI
jgi:hypothetical protein